MTRTNRRDPISMMNLLFFFSSRSFAVAGCGLRLVAVALIEGTIDEIMCQRAKQSCYRMANAVPLSNEIICGSVHLFASCSFECCDCDFDISPGVRLRMCGRHQIQLTVIFHLVIGPCVRDGNECSLLESKHVVCVREN